jgi:hypothetical protein
VLNDVAVGPLAENPARKNALPFVVALILHRQLDKRPGLGRVFPRRCFFTRAQADNRAADPRRLTGLHFDLADEPVALVEQADHRNALGHRGRALDTADFLRDTFGFGDGRYRCAAIASRRRPVAGGQRGRRQQREQRGRNRARHYSPGRQAS